MLSNHQCDEEEEEIFMEEMDLNSEEFLEFAEEAEIESDTEAYEAPDS